MKLALDQRIELAEKRVEQRAREWEWAFFSLPDEPYYRAVQRFKRAEYRLHRLRKARERMMG